MPAKTWLAAAVTAAATGLMVTVVGLPSEAAVAPVTGGVYTLASGASGKCINVSGSVLVQVACSTTTATQLWSVTAAGGNFTLGNSGNCVDGTASGVQATQSACGGAITQQWSFTASTAAAGKYLVKNASTGLCLTNRDASTAGNNPIIALACADVSQGQWSFNYVSGSTSPTTAPATTPTSTTKPTVAADGTGSYKTVQAAVDAVPANNTTKRTITIKAGTYREQVIIPANKPHLTFQGLGTDYGKTTIVMNHDAGHYGTAGSATVQALAPSLTFTNLTINNDYDENTYETGDQALAVYLDSDKSIFTNVRLLGDQDTIQVHDKARAYFYKSYIEGTTDFIYGAGIAVFNASTIHAKRTDGGYITAASTPAEKTYGFLFYKSTVNGAGTNVTYLGRPWRQGAQVLYRESSLTNFVKVAQPWIDMGDATWKNARFFEYRNTGAGATTNSNRPQMSDSTAADYTPQKYLAGSDGWNPVG